MAKKNHYYVLVLTDMGAVFVTGIPQRNWAEYDALKAPKEFPLTVAEEIALGLTANFQQAYCVKVPYEITTQPYFYNKGAFRWEWKMDITQLCYEFYKEYWLTCHTNVERRLKMVGDAYLSNQTVEDYREEHGYGERGCFASYNEFMKNEFKEKEYMKHLLEEAGETTGKNLFDEYLAFLKKEEEDKKK